MEEPKITPLARRLAEENGIDWRKLQGTGPDGLIVERDILAYLAKVMAGEVDLPPARGPAPAPQGGGTEAGPGGPGPGRGGPRRGDPPGARAHPRPSPWRKRSWTSPRWSWTSP